MLDLNIEDILSTERMFDQDKLDVRTITMGISLLGCVSDSEKVLCNKIYDTICQKAEHLTEVSHDISREYGVPIINRRISVTPIALVAAFSLPVTFPLRKRCSGQPMKWAWIFSEDFLHWWTEEFLLPIKY